MALQETERVRKIATETLAQPPETRTAFLAQSCAGDDTLLTQVLVSLEKEGAAPPPPSPAPDDLLTVAENSHQATARRGELKPGDVIGDCRIISLLGEGGMGEVYLAEDTRLERQVAVKLLKRHLADDELERRFRHERKVLAALSHPGIAQLYGASLTAEGRSYLVMEYVEGERLDHYCNRHALGVPERLALFRKVCSAVAYAHQHLVIHRDLKPPNIRVTPEGEPKLLDFGIAKLLDPEPGAESTREAADHDTENTLTVVGSMTPAYASPEQLRGEGITTATDVYSLGVILYELLAGQRPYVVKRGLPEEVAQAICEEPIRRPSVVAAAATRTTLTARPPPASAVAFRSAPPDRLRRLLAGDLDNIVAMAMRKEPERRYASASQFSEDLRRHLDGLPVIARADTLGYRAGKFIGRNKAGVAAVALVVLALVAGIITTTWQARRADRRFDDLRQLAKSMIFEVEPQIATIAGSTPARSTLIKRAVEYLDSLSREAGGNRELRGELATAYEKVGDVQGNMIYSNLGDLKGALASYRKAQTLRLALVKEDPADIPARCGLARHYEQFGSLLAWSNQVAAGMDNYREALKLWPSLLAADPKSMKVRYGYASLLTTMGDLEAWNGQDDTALAAYRQALPMMEAMAAENPKEAELQLTVARCLLHIAGQEVNKDPQAVAKLYARARGIVDPIVKNHPHDDSAGLVEYAIAYDECEALKSEGAIDEAIAKCPPMVAMAQRFVDLDPRNAAVEHNLANAHNTYGSVLHRAGRWPEAVEELQKALEIDGRLAEKSPENGEYAHSRGDDYWIMGRAKFRLGQLDAALADEQSAQRLLEEASGKDPDNNVPGRELVKVFIALGEICGEQHRFPEARQWFQKGLAQLEGLIAKKITGPDDKEDLETLRRDLSALPPAESSGGFL